MIDAVILQGALREKIYHGPEKAKDVTGELLPAGKGDI